MRIKFPGALWAWGMLFWWAVTQSGMAQPRPDFSGNWLLNKAKSKQRNPRQFRHESMEVSQQDPNLHIRIRDERPDGREFRAYLDLKTDGTPATGILGSPQRAVIRWEGSRMVIRWNIDGVPRTGSASGKQGATPPFTWTWTLSADGKTLVNDTHLYGDVTGEIVERLVFQKSP